METLSEAWATTLAFLTPYYNQLADQLAAFVQTLDPLVWWASGGALLLLLLLWLSLRRRDSGKDGRPEVLLSLGTISAANREEAGAGGLYLLRLTVSNLNPYAVQVLELALKTPEMDVPVTAEVAAVVPPEGSVALEHPFTDLSGDEGRLNLYFYTAGNRRIFRLQAPFALEPWNNRYKISPLNQSVAPVRQLPSAGVSRVQEQAWRGEQERTETTLTAKRRTNGAARPNRERRDLSVSRSKTTTKTGTDLSEAPQYNETIFPDEF